MAQIILKKNNIVFFSILMFILLLISPASKSQSNLSFDTANTSIDATAHFLPAGFVKITHDRFTIPAMDFEYLKNVTFSKTASVQIHGAPGERGQLSCRYIQQSLSTRLPCGKGSFAQDDPTLVSGEKNEGDLQIPGTIISENGRDESFIDISFYYI